MSVNTPRIAAPDPLIDEIVVADLPCTSCAYNLHLSPAEGRCPECGAPVSDSLRNTVVTVGQTRVRRIAVALTFSACLNIFLPATGATIAAASASPEISIFPLVVLSVAFFIYALLQTITMYSAAALTGECFARRSQALAISGAGMVLMPVVFWHMLVFDACRLAFFSTQSVLFLSLVVFAWLVGGYHTLLCPAGGFHGLTPWGRRIGLFVSLAVACVAFGLLFISAVSVLSNTFDPDTFSIATRIVRLGIYLLAPGLLATATFQFLLARRLQTLAATIPTPPILTVPAASIHTALLK